MGLYLGDKKVGVSNSSFVIPTDTTALQSDIANGKTAYINGGKVTGTAEERKEEQSKSVTITTNGTTSVTPDTNKVLNEVSITTNVLPNTSDATAVASEIAVGKTAYVSTGKVTGTLATLGAQSIRGSYDREGLLDIGYTNADVDVYDGICSHYKSQDNDYILTQSDKDLYGVVNGNNIGTYKYVLKYLPMFNMTRTSTYNMFYYCSLLTTIPQLDTSNVTNMTSMFVGCSSLTTIPLLDTSNVTSMDSMFSNCYTIRVIPQLDTSKVTNIQSMFSYCKTLKSIPLLDTSNVTNMGDMFGSCSSLASIPLLDTSNVTNMGGMFSGCLSLTTIPLLDTSNVTSMGSMFYNCYSLTTIPLLDTSNITIVGYMFSNCSALTTLGGFENLGQAYLTTLSANYSNYILSLSSSKQLTHDSLMNVINNLYDIATKGCNTQGLQIGSTNMAKLTATEIAVATAKGWTVS